ncbi:hypothetical protein ABZ319_25740 [Nocardia sp. NPDC005978]|uniref:hypothetical protein n=1 Tax=Nocardia sp. NPDC005978 TaxID=3156725 RepID=UPI0033A74E06
MGLAISVHSYAYALSEGDLEYAEDLRRDLAAINRVLAENDLPAHEEPETRGAATGREHMGSFPYSFLHYLRRAYAHAYTNPSEPLTPVAAGEPPTEDELVDDLLYMFDCHLISHSDAEGCYVPIDFDHVLAAEAADIALPGGILGSSVALLRELTYLAPYLGIELRDGVLTDEVAATMARTEDDDPFAREREVWLTLFESARVSVANNTLISFG